jgi:hypothetical protein
MATRPLPTRVADATAAASKGFRLIFLTSSYTPDTTNHGFVSDVIASEITDNNAVYTAGGEALTHSVNADASITFTELALNNVDISDYRYVVLAENGGTNATDRIRSIQDLGSTQTASNDNITWDDTGGTPALQF